MIKKTLEPGIHQARIPMVGVVPPVKGFKRYKHTL